MCLQLQVFELNITMSFLQRSATFYPSAILNFSKIARRRVLIDTTRYYAQDVKNVNGEKAPVKFTTSEAHVNYRAARNFYGDDRDLPDSHNYVLAGTGIFGFIYLIFLRDDIDADGGQALFKPVHETVPHLAIPLLQAAIAENKKLGYNTKKLEAKLAEYMLEPEKYGGEGHKLIEN